MSAVVQLEFDFDEFKSIPLCELTPRLAHLDPEILSSLLIEWQNKYSSLERANNKLRLENFELNRKLSETRRDEGR